MDQVFPTVSLDHLHDNLHCIMNADSWIQTTDLCLRLSGKALESVFRVSKKLCKGSYAFQRLKTILLTSIFKSRLYIPCQYKNNPVGKIIELILIYMFY